MKRFFGFRNFFVFAAVIILAVAVLSACNPAQAPAVLDRDKVVGDFKSISLSRVDERFTLDMTVDQIKGLVDYSEYIVANNAVKFLGDAIYASPLRVQKIAIINYMLSDESGLNLFSKTSNDEMASVKDGIKILSEGGLTTDDIGDLAYTVLNHTANNVVSLLDKIKADYVSYKAALSVSDFSSQNEYNFVIADIDSNIEAIDEIRSSVQGSMGAGGAVTQTVTNNADAIKKMFGALTKIILTFDTDALFNISGSISEAETENNETEIVYSATAAELAAYYSGVKNGINETVNSFSESEIKDVSAAAFAVGDILFQVFSDLKRVDELFSEIFNMFGAALPIIKIGGGLIVNGLNAYDAALIQNAMDIAAGTYPKINLAILNAKIIKSALSGHTATTLNALIDSYKNYLVGGSALTKQMMGFGYVVEALQIISISSFSENDADKIVAALYIDLAQLSLASVYSAYKRGETIYGGLPIQNKLDDVKDSILEVVEALTGSTISLSGIQDYTQAWYDKLMTESERAQTEAANWAINTLIDATKSSVTDFYTNKFAALNELAAMPLQMQDQGQWARLVELDELLGDLSKLSLGLGI
jgi:hypothetical protein